MLATRQRRSPAQRGGALSERCRKRSRLTCDESSGGDPAGVEWRRTSNVAMPYKRQLQAPNCDEVLKVGGLQTMHECRKREGSRQMGRGRALLV